MMLSEKFSVPTDAALLYDFLNTLDLRAYVERGAQHQAGDEIATPPQLEAWLRQRSLLGETESATDDEHGKALGLRTALRAFVALEPADRATADQVSADLSAACAPFRLLVAAAGGRVELRPSTPRGIGGLGQVLAQLHLLSVTGRLDRIRTCGSDECRWVFFDRSKPGNRRWCSSALCGNRQKTRTYRRRRGANTPGDAPPSSPAAT
jgi:predicted RNA-binding Zn ribbon-like protein